MSEPTDPSTGTADAVVGSGDQPVPPPLTADPDPRIVQILSTEHWSVLSARSLAYNEAFTRAGMFLSFLSMSTVALGLMAQGTGFSRDFTVIAAVVLGFDLVIGLSTYARISAANGDDLVALHGMSRIRHAYTEIAPAVERYFTAPVNDDADSVMTSYGNWFGQTVFGEIMYVMSTTGGMIALIVCAIAGVFTGLVTWLLTEAGTMSVLFGAAGAVLLFVVLAVVTYKAAYAAQRGLPVMFPAPTDAG